MANGGVIGPINIPIVASANTQTFTAPGTWTAPGGSAADVLIISGGRGGSGDVSFAGGGGFYQFSPQASVPASPAPITIGGGGPAPQGIGTASTAGFASPISAPGGTTPSGDNGNGTFVAGVPQGDGYGGPSGAGAGGNGGDGAVNGGFPGPGGPGLASPSIDATLRAGGGGGGGWAGQTSGAGAGVDGGGPGGPGPGSAGTPGTPNTGGGGGGGSSFYGPGGTGGSGYVVVKTNGSVTAPGVWTLQEAFEYKKAGTWN